jgi:hypothetical protein
LLFAGWVRNAERMSRLPGPGGRPGAKRRKGWFGTHVRKLVIFAKYWLPKGRAGLLKAEAQQISGVRRASIFNSLT